MIFGRLDLACHGATLLVDAVDQPAVVPCRSNRVHVEGVIAQIAIHILGA